MKIFIELKEKAQVFSAEILLGYFIFFLTLVIVFFMWTTTIQEIKNSEKFYAMEETVLDLGESLVKTPGHPINWTDETVSSIGLTETNEPRILNGRKVSDFVRIMNSSYEDRANLLGIGKYDFYFNLTDINGTTLEICNTSCATGKKPYLPVEMITITRTALMNQTIVKMFLTVWYGEPKAPMVTEVTTTVAATTTTTAEETTTTTIEATTTTAETTTSTITQVATTSTTTVETTTTTTVPSSFLVATKVICDNESNLPNWGGGGPNINSSTASNFLSTHSGCYLKSEWEFQWGNFSVSNPGDNIGEAASGWNTFGPTNDSGAATAVVPYIAGTPTIRVREVWQPSYINFTGASGNSTSAEFYCANDVANYDNYDFVTPSSANQTFYCIGFNVLE